MEYRISNESSLVNEITSRRVLMARKIALTITTGLAAIGIIATGVLSPLPGIAYGDTDVGSSGLNPRMVLPIVPAHLSEFPDHSMDEYAQYPFFESAFTAGPIQVVKADRTLLPNVPVHLSEVE
jgi:hypothetical protein